MRKPGEGAVRRNGGKLLRAPKASSGEAHPREGERGTGWPQARTTLGAGEWRPALGSRGHALSWILAWILAFLAAGAAPAAAGQPAQASAPEASRATQDNGEPSAA